MYGAELKDDGQDITLDNFADLIDNQSWEEFMPRGVTKELFAEFVPYYDPDMFRAVSRNYRDLVRAADKLTPLERTRDVARIFSYFRNPDKETVLTPWRVVNMHIGDCIGGQVFFDRDMQTEGVMPRFVNHGEVTEKVFKDPNTRILEINSKTGLYPLYMAYSVFAEKLQAYRDKHMLATDVPLDIQNQIWDIVLRDHIFVICKTEMAKSITKRTLRGFRQAKVNARYFEDLINKISNQPALFTSKVIRGKNYWNNSNLEENMRFNAIVGNPPYQVMDGGSGNGISAKPVYQFFVSIAKKMQPSFVSMIMPSRWFAGGKGLDDFREEMLADKSIRLLVDYPKSRDCFSNVDIAGGICYFLRDKDYSGKCQLISKYLGKETISERNLNEFDIFVRDNEGLNIIHKVKQLCSSFMSDVVFSRNPFGLGSSVRGKEEPFAGSIKVYSSAGIGYIATSEVSKNSNLINSFKVIIGKINPDRGGVNNAKDGKMNVITKVRVLQPGEVMTETYLLLAATQAIEEANNIADYYRTKLVRLLISLSLSGMNITKDNFVFVPNEDFSRHWTDTDLYERYGLSSDEINYVESMIKPMASDLLFDADELIDAEFANFDLLEHGVKVGDHIIYTPTDMELIVRGNDMVEYAGELYTISNFTAKFLPRNKRSVSGVCQGPKYFSYKGVSLYKMKESFLGGNK